MDSVHVRSFPYASVTTGANLWRRKRFTEKIYYASSCASKASRDKRKIQMKYNILRFHQPSLNHHDKCIERGPAYEECNKEYVVKAIPRSSLDSEPPISNPKNILDSVKSIMAALYWFCYPYATINQILGAISASLLAVEKLSDISPLFGIGLLQALVPLIFMGIYIGGVNQLSDLEIDKINKPYLPLASGQLSYSTGVIITTSSLILSFWLSWIIGSWPLFWCLVSCFTIWSAYSINVPLLRWKRYPLLAAMCTFLCLSIVLPISFFLHMQTFVMKRPAVFPRSLFFVLVFMSFYTVGITLFKDIPDIEGDTKFGIHSLAARLGKKKMLWISVSLCEMAFGVALLAGALSSSPFWIKIASSLGYAVLASTLWYEAKYVDLTSKASIKSLYMLIWKLLSVAYLLLPITR